MDLYVSDSLPQTGFTHHTRTAERREQGDVQNKERLTPTDNIITGAVDTIFTGPADHIIIEPIYNIITVPADDIVRRPADNNITILSDIIFTVSEETIFCNIITYMVLKTILQRWADCYFGPLVCCPADYLNVSGPAD